MTVAQNPASTFGCDGVHPEYTEQVQASGSTGNVTWNGSDWTGGGTGSANVTPLQHGTGARFCEDRCGCLNNSPGCWNIVCCGDSYFGPRLHANHGSWFGYDPADVIRQQVVFCPPCCADSDPISTGYNGAEWCCLVGMRIAYGCLDLSGLPGFPLACTCPTAPPPVQFGYVLYAQLLVRTQRLQATAGGCVGTGAGFIGFPEQSTFTAHKGVWVKPCCSANDSVRGTYRLAIPATASGTAGFPQYSWLTSRSATATVS